MLDFFRAGKINRQQIAPPIRSPIDPSNKWTSLEATSSFPSRLFRLEQMRMTHSTAWIFWLEKESSRHLLRIDSSCLPLIIILLAVFVMAVFHPDDHVGRDTDDDIRADRCPDEIRLKSFIYYIVIIIKKRLSYSFIWIFTLSLDSASKTSSRTTCDHTVCV